jgi:hypothetical protein
VHLKPRRGGNCEVDWSEPSSAAMGKKARGKTKKTVPLTGKVYLPTKRRKNEIKMQQTEAINDSEGIRKRLSF